MKRFLLSILMVVIGLSAFSQSPSRIISLSPAYPLVVGENSVDGVTFDSNSLCLTDTPLDSLPHYEIGVIGIQNVSYSENGHGFYLKADSLHSLNVTYSYEVNEQPQGAIEFNETTGRFKYYPAPDEYNRFMVTFSATNGTESISENVEFRPMPLTSQEESIFSSKGTMPDATDYTIIATTLKDTYLNNINRPARSISISGKDVIFDNNVQNKVSGLSGCEDIYELNIYAERLIIRSELKFPETDITIYAKELIFEDYGNDVASINTTPTPINDPTNGTGKRGANAGDITLNVQSVKGNLAMRLIANGANGQSANRNGTPGNGGNGGTVRSTIDLSNWCDLVRGGGGVKHDVAADGSTAEGPIIGYGNIGRDGSFNLNNDRYAYLHPYYISAVMRHANDAFINNYTEYTIETCREYHTLIDAYLNPVYENNGNGEGVHEGVHDDFDDLLSRRAYSFDNGSDNIGSRLSQADLDWALDTGNEEKRTGLQNNLLEVDKMLFKLEQGLDYFGNPEGWVPLLSFEVYLKNYENEIDRAIPTLYMYYWMNRIDETLRDMVSVSQEAAKETEKEIKSNEETLNTLIREIPVLQDEADELNRMIEELTVRIETLQNQLIAQATKNVKRKHWLKNLFGIGKVVANVVSVCGPLGAAIGSTINLGLAMASNVSEVNEAVNAIGDNPLDSLNKSLYKTDKWGNYELDKNGNKQPFDGRIQYNNVVNNQITPLVNNINNLYGILSRSVTNGEVQAEYNKLKANSQLWKDLNNQFEDLNTKKNELVNHINDVFANISNLVSELSNDALALDAFRRDAFTGNSKRDLNAMLYIEKMEQRAQSRLLKYNYYLRKAYEYRLLKAYQGEEFNKNNMFKRFESLGLALDTVVLSENDYRTLATVFREDISNMAEEILNSSSVIEQTTSSEIFFTKEQIDALNAGEDVTFNIYEMGDVFSPDEDNIRILGFDLIPEDIKIHLDGNAGGNGHVDLNLAHKGISKFRKNGRTFLFDHMPRYDRNAEDVINHNTWKIKYYPRRNNVEISQPSAASESLLFSIVGNNDVMLFSRPSAWGDITISKNVVGGADIIIDALTLIVNYDYTPRNSKICYIDVCASDSLLPYIACSEKDKYERNGGYGKLYRSYDTNKESVTFTAQDKYETYYFVNWTDMYGKFVTDKTELTVKRNKDQYYIANYERRVPILNVADTIQVDNNGGTYTVNVSNVGGGDTEMDWYVEVDSLSTFTSLNGIAEGIEEGSFTFNCEANTTGKDRVDSLVIFAPETDEMSRMIYIVQNDDSVRGDVNGDGKVSWADMWTLMGIIARRVTAAEEPRADVNLDGRINIGDVNSVIAIMAGKGS